MKNKEKNNKRIFLAGFIVLLLLAVVLTTNLVTAESSLPFSDVKETNWFYNDLVKMYNIGMVNGYPDGTFGGSKTLTKAEILKMLVVAVNPNGDYTKRPEDTYWFIPYMAMACKMGIIDEYAGQEVYGTPVTREEISEYAMKTYNQGRIIWDSEYRTDSQVDSELKRKYKDASSIGAEYKNAVQTMLDTEIMKGYNDGTFGPKKTLTRAEATAIVSRIMTLREKLYKEDMIINNNINGYVEVEG